MAKKRVSAAGHVASAVYVYGVQGTERGKRYKGSVAIFVDEDSERAVTASRSISHDGKPAIGLTGRGTLRDNKLQLRFTRPAAPASGKKNSESMTPEFRRSESNQVCVSGQFKPTQKICRMFARYGSAGRDAPAVETWTLQRQDRLCNKTVHKVRVMGDRWASVSIPVKGAGVVKVSLPRARAPQGLFLPKGASVPEMKAVPGEELFCVPAMRSGKRAAGAPAAFNEKHGPTWFRKFTKEDAKKEWLFWFRDGESATWRLHPVIVALPPFLHEPIPMFCDPYVSIEVHPHVAAAGEEIAITVSARAFAGLDMYWWFGSGTGITELDKAHIAAGSGAVTASYSWTVTIDAPGTYTFGANARDVIYWNNPSIGDGIPHQASEGCGLAYDTVEIRPEVRRSYKVGFVLLAPQSADLSSAEFQAQLSKLEDIKAALPSQFLTSTYGRGECDATYPTVVLTPPGPVYGLTDGSAMFTFVRETIRDYFYTDHPDVFDFLAIYEAYPDKAIGSRHLTVRTRVAGFGMTPYDTSADWGSAGKLSGVGLVKDVTEMPDTYEFMDSEMHLLLHEVFGHQWGVFAERLQKPGFHFDIGIESPTFTVLYGRPWRKIDETHFTTENVQDPATGAFKVTFHPWILYVAGMLQRAEVPETLMDVEPDTPPASRYDLVTTTGTYENVTLQSVIDQSGDRYDV